MSEMDNNETKMSRRQVLKLLAMSGAALAIPAGPVAAAATTKQIKPACMGQVGYAARVTDLFERAPTKRHLR